MNMMKQILNNDLVVLLSWIKGEDIFNTMMGEESKFKWDKLLVKLSYNLDEYVELNDIDDFEEIVYESYLVFNKIDNVDMSKLEILKKEEYKNELIRISEFKNILNDILIDFDFENQDLNKKKKNILKERLEKYIKEEKYEECISIKNKLEMLN